MKIYFHLIITVVLLTTLMAQASSDLEEDNYSRLPLETKHEVFNHLDFKTFINVSAVSRNMRQDAENFVTKNSDRSFLEGIILQCFPLDRENIMSQKDPEATKRRVSTHYKLQKISLRELKSIDIKDIDNLRQIYEVASIAHNSYELLALDHYGIEENKLHSLLNRCIKGDSIQLNELIISLARGHQYVERDINNAALLNLLRVQQGDNLAINRLKHLYNAGRAFRDVADQDWFANTYSKIHASLEKLKLTQIAVKPTDNMTIKEDPMGHPLTLQDELNNDKLVSLNNIEAMERKIKWNSQRNWNINNQKWNNPEGMYTYQELNNRLIEMGYYLAIHRRAEELLKNNQHEEFKNFIKNLTKVNPVIYTKFKIQCYMFGLGCYAKNTEKAKRLMNKHNTHMFVPIQQIDTNKINKINSVKLIQSTINMLRDLIEDN